MRNKAGQDEPAAGHPGRPVPPRPVLPPPAAHPPGNRQREDGPAAPGDEPALDACIARLIDQAPPLTSQQRDALALLLRRPSRRDGPPGPPPLPGRVS